MHLINAKYKIMDTFEKNPHQSLMLGVSLEDPDDVVVINEVLWSPLFTTELVDTLCEGMLNLKDHSLDAQSCQLVTSYHHGMPVGNYLTGRTLPFRTRINLCYEYLKAMTSYNRFPAWVQDILIDEDQIIVWESKLHYNELLILKTDDADHQASVTFYSIRRKVHQMLSRLTGASAEMSEALTGFMTRLAAPDSEFDSLQAVYDAFQKVYLYDYYLDQDDTVRPTAAVEAHSEPVDTAGPVIIPILPVQGLPTDEPDPEETDWIFPDAEPKEEPLPQEHVEPDAPSEDGLPSEPEIKSAEEDIDSDMEKNLELFFNRQRGGTTEPDVYPEEPAERRKGIMALLAIAAVIFVIAAAAIYYFGNAGAPTASFDAQFNEGVWTLTNTSEFKGKATLKRSEWTVYLEGQLIDLYDMPNLTLTVEEPGTYQVVLRVMDSNGKWSQPFKKTLEAKAAAPGDAQPASDTPLSEGERMDQYTWKFDADRVVKDQTFVRDGAYSLRITPGKSPATLEISGIMVNKNGMASLWVASEKADAFTVTFTGYNQEAKLFTKKFDIDPLGPMQWEMRQFTIDSEKVVNRLVITVDGASVIYIDDLSIDSYK